MSTNIFLLDCKKEKELHKKFYYDNVISSLEEYAHNYDNTGIITDVISLEEVPITNCTLLTCCCNLISDDTFNILKSPYCPLCRQLLLIKYVRVRWNNKIIIIGYNDNETVIELKNKIANKIKFKCYFKLCDSRTRLRIYPEENTIKQINIYFGIKKSNIYSGMTLCVII